MKPKNGAEVGHDSTESAEEKSSVNIVWRELSFHLLPACLPCLPRLEVLATRLAGWAEGSPASPRPRSVAWGGTN